MLKNNQNSITELSDSLITTVTYMDEMDASRKEMEEMKKPLEPGAQAPDFELLNENNELVSLSDYRGKKVTLVFSQKGCTYCEEFYPVINQFAEQHKEDTEILILQANASVTENKQTKIDKLIIPSLLQTDGTEMMDYKVFQTPTTVVIDAEGKIQATQSVLDLEEMTVLLKGYREGITDAYQHEYSRIFICNYTNV